MSAIHTLFQKIFPKNNRKAEKCDNTANKRIHEISKRRAAIIDALNKSIEIFAVYKEKTFDDVMTNGIRPLADAVGLDRVVFYAAEERDGIRCLGQIYRWDKSEGGIMFLADELRVLPNIPVIENWISILSCGGHIRLRESDYSKGEAELLRNYGVKSILIVPIFTQGEFWGAINFQDHTSGRYFDEDCADLLYTAACVFSNAIIKEKAERNTEEAIKALKRREKMASALNRAAVLFLSQSEVSFRDTMTAGIMEIADTFNLDRFSIWRNFAKSEPIPVPSGEVSSVSVMHVSQIYRWDRESGGTTLHSKGLDDVTYSQLAPRWEKLLASGETINSPAKLLPEAAMLQSFGCISAFVTPLFINNIFWGFALLEDRHNERYFEEDSVEMMRSAAFLCANTVIRADMEREITNANEFTRAVLDASPLSFTVFDENARVIDCNDSTLKALMTTKEYYIDRFYEFSPEYQDNGVKSSDKVAEVVKRALDGEKLVFEWINRASTGEIIPHEVTMTRTKYNEKYVAMGYQYDLRKTKTMLENIREQSEQLKIRLKQQELISEISRGFISSGDSETLVKEAIARLGRYHNVSLVFIFAMDFQNNDTYLAYHWYAENTPQRRLLTNLFEQVKHLFPENLPDCATLPIVACDNTAAATEPVFQALHAVNVLSVIGAPLYVEGRLWGIISVEQESAPRKWTSIEKSFVSMLASTVSGVIMRDLYNAKIRDALQKANAASKAKSEFLSNMSHEMRTPLNAITGMTAIGRNAKNIERKDYALDKIGDASTHLLGVINDVLDMSKIEANMLELSPVEFNFEKVLQKAATVINFRIDEKKQKLTLKIGKEIPQTLIADDQRLAQVVTNLLSNAVKFTPEEGSIALDARLMGEENGLCTIQVLVSDTGIGISEEQQKRLFNPFQQAESSTTRKFGGTGLGLAISKSIVEMMGGRIFVRSEPGKGSVFSFTIQAKRGMEERISEEMRGEGEKQINIDGIFTGYRILLAEDMEINREIVMTLLEPTQLEIDCAENGVQAVSKFSEAPDRYGLILMDIQMPEMDGYEATRLIRIMETELRNAGTYNSKSKTTSYNKNLHNHIPIIAMTANVFREDIEKCLNAGMDGHIGKPIDFEEVMEKLRVFLLKGKI